MSQEVDDLITETAETFGKVDSLIVLVDGLADLIEANIDDKPKVLQILADMRAQKQEVQDALDRNSGDPPPPPPT